MTDSISRCELFNKLATIPAPPEANDFKAQVYMIIQSMETSEKWIPCSERLPKKYEQVLCCNKDGRVFSTALTYVHPEYKYWYFGKHRSVIAWMPLPEPYREEE